jgi:hypothetical protein
MPDLTRLTQPDWKNLPLGQSKSGAGVDPMTALMLLVTMGPSLLKMLGGGGEEPSPRDLRTQDQNQFRSEGERAAGIVRRTGQPESAGQNILAQMAMAGKPRTTTTTEKLTEPEEGLDIGSLLTLLLMMGQKKEPTGLANAQPLGGDLNYAPTGLQGSPGAGVQGVTDTSKLGDLLSLMFGLR